MSHARQRAYVLFRQAISIPKEDEKLPQCRSMKGATESLPQLLLLVDEFAGHRPSQFRLLQRERRQQEQLETQGAGFQLPSPLSWLHAGVGWVSHAL